MSKYDFDVCVIGAGAGGLTVAGGAALFGLKTCLIERSEMGGDCLNTGCVPSKALIAGADKAKKLYQTYLSSALTAASSPSFTSDFAPDFRCAMNDVQDAISAIAPHDSIERFENMGCTVIQGEASFKGPDRLEVNGKLIKARYFVIATGSKPRVPRDIGLEDLIYFTTENIWMLRECPEHLMILGAGPVGMELGQAFHSLGAEVTISERSVALPREDRDLAQHVITSLEGEGVTIAQNSMIIGAATHRSAIRLRTRIGDMTEANLDGDALLLAAGRQIDVSRLGLENAGVHFTEKGIAVDKGLRTTNKRIFAVGDVRGVPHLTHASGYDAITVLKRMIFKLPAKVNYSTLPRVTYTRPEIAQLGLTLDQARARYGHSIKVFDEMFGDNDRAICDGATTGMARLIVTDTGKFLGFGAVGDGAGELMLPMQLLAQGKVSLNDLSSLVLAYPTRGEIIKALADKALQAKLFSGPMKSLAKWLIRL